jgi:acyl-coenzyme A thioesterase PaaI-like protein
MPTSFGTLMQSAARGPGEAALDVPEDWMQGRSAFGGLQAALLLAAMRTRAPEVPLRTMQATFLAPVPAGRVTARAQVLRSGKNATHVEARLVGADGEGTLALAVGVFGVPRPSGVAVLPVQPEAPREPTAVMRHGPGVAAFAQHFNARWLRGLPPFTGDRGTEHVLEVDMIDDGAATEAHVLALADFIPPIAISHLTSPAPGSTLTWMIELLVDRLDGVPLAGWRVDASMAAARDGYTSQSLVLWAPGGRPVALGRQSMVVFG